MHITIFEEKDFIDWCKDGINDHKESILKRAFNYLLSISTTRKAVKGFTDGEDLIFNNLDLIDISYDVLEGEDRIYNTCLGDKCLTILYDDFAINDICKEKGINISVMEKFMNNLSNYITDSSIMEWKLHRGLPVSCVKVENSKFGEPTFFPVSYLLFDLIHLIERATLKRIKFTPDKSDYASITKENIICYFSPNRLETEYIIAEQLMYVYLNISGFEIVDKNHFMNMANWVYDTDALKTAFYIVVQNKFINLTIAEEYPIYSNPTLYSLMNFRNSEEYMSAVCRYICSYSKKNKLCSNCSGLDDIFNQEGTCPLYKDNSIMDRFFYLDEINTPEKQEKAVNEFLTNFLSK